MNQQELTERASALLERVQMVPDARVYYVPQGVEPEWTTSSAMIVVLSDDFDPYCDGPDCRDGVCEHVVAAITHEQERAVRMLAEIHEASETEENDG